MRKNYAPGFKAMVVIELLREELTIGQLSSKYEIHQTQIAKWKKIVLEGIPELLSEKRRKDTLIKAHEEEVRELYAQIGELTTKLNWLKKKSGIEPQ